jgi:3-phenylpropionate/trans-cinnamate dioxygenase ferredoxin subunit
MTQLATLARHRVGGVADFELGRFRVFSIDGRPVGVVKTSQGFFAVRNRCPHQGASICAGRVTGTMEPSAPGEFSFSEETMVVTCPWHRWEFVLDTGESYCHVTTKRLVTYPVEIESGEVYVIMKGRRAT